MIPIKLPSDREAVVFTILANKFSMVWLINRTKNEVQTKMLNCAKTVLKLSNV